MKKKKYVQVGTGGRARMYYGAIATTYKDSCELCAICDLSQTRMDFTNRTLAEEFGYQPVPTYHYTDFEKMIEAHRPDCVIVTSVDRTHHIYITRAMELGCDGVLMNTAIAEAKDPILMAKAMKHAVIAGRQAYLAGRMPKKMYADPSSPLSGLI